MRVRFGEFVVDGSARQLLRRGAPIAITPKALQLLQLLVDAAPHVVPRDRLYERLWPNQFVEPGNLHNLIAEIRTALGDATHTFIRTVHRGGYALDAEVVRESGAPFRLLIGEEEIALPEGETVIGRDQIDAPEVSRRHARITVREGIATLEDLGSKNGTFVGTRRIDAAVELREGDEVTFGRTRAVFTAAGATSTLTVAR